MPKLAQKQSHKHKVVRDIFSTVASNANKKTQVYYTHPSKGAYCDMRSKAIYLPQPRANLDVEDFMILRGYQRHEELHVRYSSANTYGHDPHKVHSLYNVFEDVRINARGCKMWADYGALVNKVWQRITHRELIPALDSGKLTETAPGAAMNYLIAKVNDLQAHGLRVDEYPADIRAWVDQFVAQAEVQDLWKQKSKEENAWTVAQKFYDELERRYPQPDQPPTTDPRGDSSDADDSDDSNSDGNNFADPSDNVSEPGTDSYSDGDGESSDEQGQNGQGNPEESGGEGDSDNGSSQGQDGGASTDANDGTDNESTGDGSQDRNDSAPTNGVAGHNPNAKPEDAYHDGPDLADVLNAEAQRNDQLMNEQVNDLAASEEEYEAGLRSDSDHDTIRELLSTKPTNAKKPVGWGQTQNSLNQTAAREIAQKAVRGQRTVIKKALLAKAQADYQHHLEDGYLDTKRKLPAVAAGQAENLYMEKRHGKAPRCAVHFCIDMSGSMCDDMHSSWGVQAHDCRYDDHPAKAEQDLIDKLTAKTPGMTRNEVAAEVAKQKDLYNNRSGERGVPNRCSLSCEFVVAMCDELNKYRGETGVTMFEDSNHLIKPLSGKPLSANQRLVLQTSGPGGGTCLAGCVAWAVEGLLKSSLDRKVIFIVTDGYAWDSTNVHSALNYAKMFGIEVYGVSIGDDGLKEYGALIPKRAYVKHTDDLSRELARLFKDMVTH